MIAATIVDRLRDVAGAAAVRPEAELERYAVAGVTPRAVVMPSSVDAVAATLAVCTEEGWPVEPAGAASWLAAGRPPAEPPVVVSTAALTSIREYEPADLVAGAEAGVALSSLQQELARNRQTIVLDPPGASVSTIGAIAATAAAGPLRAGHGTPRDMVIGAEVVTADGRVLHFGGRVVKNVAGYDLVRLLVGSRGSFGIITSLFLRLRGTPETDTTFAISLPTMSEAIAAVAEVRGRMEPDALELLGPSFAPLLATTGAWTVLARFRGSAASRDEAASRIQELAGKAVRQLAAEPAAAVWDGIARSEADAELYVRAADLPNHLAGTLAAVGALGGDKSRSDNELSDWHVAVHAADGIVRLWPAGAPDEGRLAGLAVALPTLAQNFTSRRGTVTWPVWPTGASVAAPAPPLPAAVELRLARDLKARFDPAGILSPGRHLSGL